MSRGLGRVERFVLSWLVTAGGSASLSRIAEGVAGLIDCPACEAPLRARPCSAAYKATARAVASLDRKHLITTKIERGRWNGRHEPTYWKSVELSVESVEALQPIQRLECAWTNENWDADWAVTRRAAQR